MSSKLSLEVIPCVSPQGEEALSHEDECLQGLRLGDEWANSLTHGVGLLFSLIGLIFLLIPPFQDGNDFKLAVFGVYGGTLVLLYGASTLYHAVRQPMLKRILRTVDHCAIYLLIAGSYTPFTMLLLEGLWGWVLFGTIWSLAFLGILFKVCFRHRFNMLSTSIYLFMGWLVVVAAEQFINHFHTAGLCWLIAGGLSYTVGVIFFVLDHRRFYHAIWHMFVLGGSTCHYFAVFWYL